jgi:hypothetical protein
MLLDERNTLVLDKKHSLDICYKHDKDNEIAIELDLF